MFTNTLLIYLAFWKLQKTVAKHRRLELSTKRGYGTKRDSSYFMKSQGILMKTVSKVGELENLHLHGTTGNSGWKIKWFAPFPVFQLESFRKYGLWLEAMQFVSYFIAYSADFILCSRASSHTNSLQFSSGIVERAKRKRAWKSPHARKARGGGERGFLAWGDFHARSRFARSTIPEEKWGLLVVKVSCLCMRFPPGWFVLMSTPWVSWNDIRREKPRSDVF